uniref:Proteasome subunit beta n=2 Tax=Cacopsylla melanoneura TaxID=428564 RepID=A0A8D8WA50_9HEMI
MALLELSGIQDILKKNTGDNFLTDMKYLTANFENQMQLSLPPFANPADDLGQLNQDEFGRPIHFDFDHGTTCLGFQYNNGVVLAVDSRATGGNYIGSGTMKKIVEINDYLLGTLAGGAADCVYWDRVLAKQCRLYELRNGERISVAAASKLMCNMAYNYKGTGLSMGMMIAGWDKRGPQLYYVDSDGQRIKGNVFSVGSGSVFAFGVLDTGYHWNLTDDEAHQLARKSIYHATYRDFASGGLIRVYRITSDGWIHLSTEDCKDVHYEFEAKKQEARMTS